MNKASSPIIAFHIGINPRNRRPGRITYMGEYNISQLIAKREPRLIIVRRDPQGRTVNPYYSDKSGRKIFPYGATALQVGRLNIQGDRDTDYCLRAQDASVEELNLITDSGKMPSPALSRWLYDHYTATNDEPRALRMLYYVLHWHYVGYLNRGGNPSISFNQYISENPKP